ncbi:hypothetical protein EYR38_000267 [Pleurotus pulmonarius]|nr:hypothetical protein EYR38_000267 [Pleurotus pulmonarius]
MNSVPLPVGTIRNAFNKLKRMVDLDLNIQQGDAARLNDRAQHCISLLALVNQHANLFDHEERATITSSLDNMISHLEDAAHRSADPPDAPFFPTTSITRTGKPGRPRIDIDPNLLSVAYELRGPAHLADVFGVHPRTVRRRILEQGLAEPGEPVYIDYEQPDGTIARVYRSSTGASSSITDDELDTTVLYILEAFPGFGRRMIDGHLKFLGHHIPRSRIEASYTRVHGAPATGFGPRFVVAIQVSSNNTARTVLDVFIDAIETHGIPSRVRADYGTENLLVAALMESLKGLERGSYIWGRSVHNVRIERLWRDITLGFGQKWKQFFEHLEVHHNLNHNLNAHIWLLHHLFSDDLNEDANAWAEAWNSHVLSIRGERQRSPKDMFVFGMMEHGMHGVGGYTGNIDDKDLSPEELQEYGIDWTDYEDSNIQTHLDANNCTDELGHNPFLAHQPRHLSHVPVDTPECPFASDDDICGRLGCGRPWLLHDALTVSPSSITPILPVLPPLSISDPVSAWEPRAEHVNAESSGGSTNDRRVQHSRRAGLGRATAPAFGGSATLTGTSQRVSTQRAMGHRSYPPSSQATSSTQSAATIQNFRAGQQTMTVGGISKQTFLILLLPYIADSLLYTGDHLPEMPEIRLFSRSFPQLIEALTFFHLALEVTITARPDEQVWQVIHREIVQHAINRHFHFPSYELDVNKPLNWYSDSPFVLLKPGHKNTRYGKKVVEIQNNTFAMTLANLDRRIVDKSFKNHPDRSGVNILFYTSRTLMQGPIDATNLAHPCFISRVVEYLQLVKGFESPDPVPAASCTSDSSMPSTPSEPSILLPPLSNPNMATPQLLTRDSSSPEAESLRRSSRLARPRVQAQHRIAIDVDSEDDLPHLPINTILYSTAPIWQSSVTRAMNASHPEATTALSLVAATEGDAALALVQRIVAHHANTNSDTIQYPAGVEFTAFSFQDLAHGRRHLRVGSGVGSGVERAVIRAAIRLITSDTSYWRNHDGFVVWALRPDPNNVNAHRLACARAHGTLCALHMVWLAAIPHPVSPFLLLLAIHGFSALIDSAFIRKVNPQLADTLSAWPMDPSTPISISTMEQSRRILLVLSYIGISSVQELRDASTAERTSWTFMIFASSLLGARDEHVRVAPEISAFIEGFNMCLTPQLDLIKAFGKPAETKSLLLKMDARQVSDPAQLIEKIHMIDHPSDDHVGSIFMSHFARYLRGSGHPNPQDRDADFITPSTRLADAHNHVYRAQHFLQVCSGSDILPTESGWTIDMCFIHELPHRVRSQTDNEPENIIAPAEATYPVFSFHACSSEVGIFDTPRLHELLQIPLPEDDVMSTLFDLAVHSQIIDFDNGMGNTGFNQL